MSEKTNQPSKRIRGLAENFKPGERVHIGHATKGGTGVIGRVVKVEGGNVHIENDKGDRFKGPISRATRQMDEGIRRVERQLKSKAVRTNIHKADQATVRKRAHRGEYLRVADPNNPRTSDDPKQQSPRNPEKREGARKAAAARDAERTAREARKRAKKLAQIRAGKANESFDKLTPAQERDAERRLKPTRATVAKVRLRATGDEIADKVKKWQSEKGGNPGNTKNRRKRDLRLRDLRLRGEEVEVNEVLDTPERARKYMAASGAAQRRREAEHAKLGDKYRKGEVDRSELVKSSKEMIRRNRKSEEGRRKAYRKTYPKGSVQNPKRSNESVELDELRRDTLGSYADKAQGDIEGIENILKAKGEQGPVSAKHRAELERELRNRTKGRKTAIRKKYTREDAEQVDELKTSTLQSYVDKAMKDNQNRAVRLANVAPAPTPKKEMGKLRKRRRGIHSAKSRLGEQNVGESVELDELKMPKKDERGRIIDPTVRAAVKQGYHRADTKADVALRRGDTEGAEGPMFRARKRKIASRTEEVELDEVSPPGFEGTVKAMKKHKDIDNPYALAWYMKNKGFKSHKTKEGKDKK